MGLYAVDTHELVVGSEGDIVQAAVETGIVGLNGGDTLDAQLLDDGLVNVVDQVQVRGAVLGIGEHNGAVATNQHALDGAVQLKLGAVVANQVQFVGSRHIGRQVRLGIVLEEVLGDDIVGSLQQGHLVGGLVGLDNDVAGSLADPLLPLAVNGGRGVFAQRLVALGLNRQRISAGLKVLKHEHAVVIFIGRVACHFLAVLAQDDYSTVDRSPLVHGACIVVVQVVDEMVVDILHGTHDVALVVGGETKVLTDTAGDADTFLMAIVDIQRTVACRLIGMEITLNQEARSAMLEHTQVAGVSDTCIGIHTRR